MASARAPPPAATDHRRRAGGEIDRHRSAFSLGDRVFHQKFGNGNVTAIDGNKLTIQFDKAGEKRVVDTRFGGEGVISTVLFGYFSGREGMGGT